MPVFTKPAQGHVRGAAVACGPARIACLSSLLELRFHECPTFKRLPSYVRELGVLKELSFAFMARLKALPDARGLTALQSLQILSPENQAAADGHWGAAFAEAPCVGVAE